MNNERFLLLLQKYADGLVTLKEHDELFEMIASGQYKKLLDSKLNDEIAERNDTQSIELPPHIAQEVVHNIFAAEESTLKALPSASRFRLQRWLVAASVAACIALSVYYFYSSRSSFGYEPESFANEKLVITSNETNQPLIFVLDDGSTVSLKPGASLQYPRKFLGNKREVLLKGEGSFDIAKKAQKPFFVYYNHIVTKVVGTSFTVCTNKVTGNPEVSVREGKVQVYPHASQAEQQQIGVILTPNHKAIYDKSKKIFQTALVDHPLPIILPESSRYKAEKKKPSFFFEQERMDQVLAHLEEYFGISLVVENDALNHCFFTGDLSRGDLYDQLQIICLTIRASYEVNGTTVLIKGRGCSE